MNEWRMEPSNQSMRPTSTLLSAFVDAHVDSQRAGWLTSFSLDVYARQPKRGLRLLENQPELSLTSLTPARSPLPRGVTVYPATAPPPCSLKELVSLIPQALAHGPSTSRAVR